MGFLKGEPPLDDSPVKTESVSQDKALCLFAEHVNDTTRAFEYEGYWFSANEVLKAMTDEDEYWEAFIEWLEYSPYTVKNDDLADGIPYE